MNYEYEVIYRIQVQAKSSLQAALEVEKWLNKSVYRPTFEVKNLKTNHTTIIDLDKRYLKT